MNDGIPSSVAGSATSARRLDGTERTRATRPPAIRVSEADEAGQSRCSPCRVDSVHGQLRPPGPTPCSPGNSFGRHRWHRGQPDQVDAEVGVGGASPLAPTIPTSVVGSQNCVSPHRAPAVSLCLRRRVDNRLTRAEDLDAFEHRVGQVPVSLRSGLLPKPREVREIVQRRLMVN